MPKTLAALPQDAAGTRTRLFELIDAAAESAGRLTVARLILLEHQNGSAAPGAWDIAVAEEIIQTVIDRLIDGNGEAA